MEPFYKNQHLQGSGEPIPSTGWLPPKPDLRDYTENTKEVKAILKKLLKGEKKLKQSYGVGGFGTIWGMMNGNQ